MVNYVDVLDAEEGCNSLQKAFRKVVGYQEAYGAFASTHWNDFINDHLAGHDEITVPSSAVQLEFVGWLCEAVNEGRIDLEDHIYEEEIQELCRIDIGQ